MSTRTNIVVKGNNSVIYKHSDGYPEYILPIIVPFLRVFKNNRGNDPEYCIASIIREFTRQEIITSSDWYKQIDRNSDEIPREFCFGYGVSEHIHGDIDYLYIVDLKNDGWVDVYEVGANDRLIHVKGICLKKKLDGSSLDIGSYNDLTPEQKEHHKSRLVGSIHSGLTRDFLYNNGLIEYRKNISEWSTDAINEERWIIQNEIIPDILDTLEFKKEHFDKLKLCNDKINICFEIRDERGE